jgi:hypothetical protein
MGKTSYQVKVRLTDEQKQIVENLVGIMGGSEADVLRSIFLAWLSDKSVLSEVIKKRWLDGNKTIR